MSICMYIVHVNVHVYTYMHVCMYIVYVHVHVHVYLMFFLCPAFCSSVISSWQDCAGQTLEPWRREGRPAGTMSESLTLPRAGQPGVRLTGIETLETDVEPIP